MDRSLGSTKVIDFFGIPGSGKTTIAKKLIDELRGSGYQVQDNIYRINNEYNYLRRVMIKFINTISFSLRNPVYLYELFKMLGEKPFVNKRECIKQWVNICFVMVQINKTDGNDVIIADQGIAQSVISLTQNASKSDINNVFKKLKKKVGNVYFINIIVDIDVGLKRLKKRKGVDSRVEQLECEYEKKQVLEKIKFLSEKLSKRTNPIEYYNNNNFSSHKVNEQQKVNDFITSIIEKINL